jgi:hypothetical protein
LHDKNLDKNTDDVTRKDLSRIFRKIDDVAILNQPTTLSVNDNESTTKNTDDVTTEKIIIEPRISQKSSNDEITILNQQTTEVDNERTTEKVNTDDVIVESSSSIPGNATEPLVIIDPRSQVNMKEIDYEMAKDLKLVRQIDESRQQQYQQVFCNDKTAPLAGTSIDKFYVVQSPFYPQNYPTFLW